MDKILLIRYFKNTATENERRQLHNWIESSPENKEIFLRERRNWETMLMNTPAELFNETFQKKTNTYNLKTVKGWLQVAAVILLVFGAGWFIRNITITSNNTGTACHTIIVPTGQRVQLQLADGSTVWLNSKTKLTIPEKFSTSTRQVTLDGEGFFKVAKNATLPFKVNTEKYTITVLGTEFNVNAYKGSEVFETSLNEGSVSIENPTNHNDKLLLKPGQKAIYNNQKLELTTADSIADSFWKEGIYYFNNISFAEMLKRLERYYGVSFKVVNKEVLKYECTGKFRQSESLEHILNVVKADNHFCYAIDDTNKSIIIK